MLDYAANDEAIKKVIEIDKKLHEDDIDENMRTKLMFEQMLRGLYINQY